MAIEGCSPSDAYRTVRRIKENGGIDGFQETTPSPAVKTRPLDAPILPSTITPIFETPHKHYLQKRGFDPEYLVEKYDLKSCHTVGLYRWRIIIPIYLNKTLVNFTARAIRKGLEPRYRHCPNDRAVVPRRDIFYNIDNVKGKSVVIVEGPTDVWRIGDGAICSFGTEVTDGQIALLLKKKIKNVYILFDKGDNEDEQAKELSKRLNLLFDYVEILELIDEADPGESGAETIEAIREVLNGGN
jgi:DNA primase